MTEDIFAKLPLIWQVGESYIQSSCKPSFLTSFWSDHLTTLVLTGRMDDDLSLIQHSNDSDLPHLVATDRCLVISELVYAFTSLEGFNIFKINQCLFHRLALASEESMAGALSSRALLFFWLAKIWQESGVIDSPDWLKFDKSPGWWTALIG